MDKYQVPFFDGISWIPTGRAGEHKFVGVWLAQEQPEKNKDASFALLPTAPRRDASLSLIF